VWKECGSACTPSCSNPFPTCTTQCVARCECPQSAPIFDNGNCISYDMCQTCEKIREKYEQLGCCNS
jgi:hypothetical protein